MKKITLISILFSAVSCSYAPYSAINKEFIEKENIKPEQIQFYNANRIVLWDRIKRQSVDSKELENTGKIENNKYRVDEGFSFKKNLGYRVKSDDDNDNILYVITDKNKPNKTLKFMRLSEATNKTKKEFIEIFGLEKVPLLNELYYLIPEKISKQVVHKKIRTKSRFLRRFQKTKKNVYCGTILWGEETHQVYFKNPTFLMISKEDDKKSRTKIKKHKGNYIKDK